MKPTRFAFLFTTSSLLALGCGSSGDDGTAPPAAERANAAIVQPVAPVEPPPRMEAAAPGGVTAEGAVAAATVEPAAAPSVTAESRPRRRQPRRGMALRRKAPPLAAPGNRRPAAQVELEPDDEPLPLLEPSNRQPPLQIDQRVPWTGERSSSPPIDADDPWHEDGS